MKTLRAGFVVLVVISALGVSSARADQPHMRNALGFLREARTALQRAVPNKGGHRERAIEHVDRAIAEVEAGIAYAR
jgi:hypothetical protein